MKKCLDAGVTRITLLIFLNVLRSIIVLNSLSLCRLLLAWT